MFAGAPVVLHLAGSANLPPDHPAGVMAALEQGIERATEKEVVIDDLSRCSEADCIEELGARYDSTEVVLVRLVGAVRTGRAVVSLGAPSQGTLRRVDLEYPLERAEEWPAIFGGLAAILFPRSLRPPAPPKTVEVVAPPPPAEEESGVGAAISWAAIGTGAAFAIAATGMRIHSNAVRSDVGMLTEDDPMRADLIDESNAHGLASNLLFGAAAVAIASGAVYLLTR
jgi:hypothetical protein